MKECIVILGMHRSGTSVLTGLASILGCYAGFDLMKPTKDNPKGYFENNKIYLLNKKILRHHKARWDDYHFTIKEIEKEIQRKYVKEAKLVLQEELKYVNKTIIKDPRLCILFPIWQQALDELGVTIKIIFAYRNPLEVAYSLKHRDKIPLEKGLMLWTHYFFQAEYYSRGYHRIVIKYNDDFIEMDSLLTTLSQFIGLDINKEIIYKANDFYSPSLKHHNLNLNNISSELPAYLKGMVALIRDGKIDDRKLVDRLGSEFYNDMNYYLYNEKDIMKIISNQKKHILKLDEELKQKDEKLRQKDEKLRQKDEKLREKDKKIYSIKKQLSNTKNKLTKEANENLQQKIKLNKKIELLESQSATAEDILTTVLSNKSIKEKLEKSISNGIFPLKVKKWRYLFGKTSTKRLLRQKYKIINSGFFSPYYYLTSYPDVWKAKVNPLDHFCNFGWKENRNPSKNFNTREYLKNNPDVAQANINPLVHYLADGQKEGRLPNPIKTSTNHVSELRTNKNTLEKDNSHLLGPIFNNRWANNSSIISLLSNDNKIIEKEIPKKLLEKAQQLNQDLPLRVSVIMPTWNRENVISLAIDSALNQSFPIYELIISDDGSTDNTIELIQLNYPKEIACGKIKILKNKHKGVSASRNAALIASSGDLIAYLDSDNQWRKDFLLLMVAIFNELDELNCAYSALKSHDNDRNRTLVRGTSYNRKQLLHSNFIDLNIFVHRRIVYEQFGGFDTDLKRLVDWELIIRYTKNYEPAYLPFIGADYFLDNKKFNNITTTVSLNDNLQRIYDTHFQERVRYGLDSLRIAYILWDFPALSQTFVLLEIKELIQQGYDVKVYYSIQADKSAVLDFSVDATQVSDIDELASLLLKDERNLCHSHFAYPTVTLLTYPVCKKINIPFTFMPHAVDIFHHDNKERNKIAEISQHPLCLKVFVYGEFHKNFIESCGVPSHKISFNFQAVDVKYFSHNKAITSNNPAYTGIVVARFIDKKGIKSLIDAALLLKDDNVIFEIYGYGVLEEEYKQQIKRLDLDNVILKGSLKTQKALAKSYQKADFLIAPCVIANNGDMDGFPTVILEAMAMGLPVITTDISAIPDYLTNYQEALIAPANHPEALAACVRELKSMPDIHRQDLIENAKIFLKKKIGVARTVQRLLDTWLDYRIEIFLVTFNTQKYDDREETFEIIRRIFEYTTTPFTLTIVDNQSDADFWQAIIKQVKGKSNVRLIRKQNNQYCGPASNIALELSDSEYAIYLCSKEGFIKDHGWERTLIEYMRSHSDEVIAGHPSYLPKYIYGHEYSQFPEFHKFRNQDYAQQNPEKIFAHIQGGVYIVKREFIAKHGGFNPLLPHGAMDIEFSYYIESLGYPLGVIPEIISITTKTLPKITMRLTEKTVVAHPLTLQTGVSVLDVLKTNTQGCNICNWKGETLIKNNDIDLCPKCNSTGLDRMVAKYLAGNHHIYRNESLLTLGISHALTQILSSQFNLILRAENYEDFINKIEEQKSINYFIIDLDLINKEEKTPLWDIVLNKLAHKGEVLFIGYKPEKDIQNIKYINYSSQYFAYDWRKLAVLSK